jgi:hypothetical protein
MNKYFIIGLFLAMLLGGCATGGRGLSQTDKMMLEASPHAVPTP